MRDLTISIGADASHLLRELEQTAAELNKLRGTGDITGRQLAQSFEMAQQAQRDFREAITLTQVSLRRTEKEMSATRQALRKLGQNYKELGINMNDLEASYDRISRQIDEQKGKMTEAQMNARVYIKTISMLRNEKASLNQNLIAYRNGLDMTKLTTDRLRTANRELAASGGDLGNSFRRVLGVANQLAGAFGFGLGLYGLMRVFRSATQTIVQFDEKIRSLAAISGATERQMQELSRSAIQLGSASRFGATGVSEMMTQLAKMGFAVTEIQAMSAGITKLAVASGEELEPAAETVASIIRAMGLDARDTAQVVDTLALSFTRSALDLSRFRESMKYVAPLASQANFSLENTSAILAKLADAGIRGSLAGTSLRNVFSALADQSSALSQRLGGNINDFDTFIDAMEELVDAGVTTEEMFQLIDRRAVTALTTIANNTQSIRNMDAAMQEANGAADEMANIQMQAISNQTKMAAKAWQGFILAMDKGDGAFSNLVRNTLRGFSRSMQDISTRMTLQSKEMQEQVQILSTWERALNNTNNTLEDKRKILEVLKAEYPEMFSDMDIEIEKWEEITGILAKAIEKKRTYLGIQFGQEDIDEYRKNINRAEEDLAGLSRELRMFLLLGRDTPEFQRALEQLAEAQEDFSDNLDKGVTNYGIFAQTIDGTGILLDDFRKALSLERTIEENLEALNKQTIATELYAIKNLDAAEAIREVQSLQERSGEIADDYIADMQNMADAALEGGRSQIQAIEYAYDEIVKTIRQRIDDIRKSWETDWPDAPSDAFKGDLVLIEMLEQAIFKVIAAGEERINSQREQTRQTEQQLRLEQRIEEARARVALDGVALEERLSQIRLKYANLIAKETLREDELNKTLHLNELNRIAEKQQIEIRAIRHRQQLEEDAHRRRMEQMNLEQQLAQLDITGEGMTAREAQLNRELNLLEQTIKDEDARRKEQRKREIDGVTKQIKSLEAAWDENNQEMIDKKNNLEAELTHIEEKFEKQRTLNHAQAQLRRLQIEEELHKARIDALWMEQQIQQDNAEFQREIAMYEAERVKNLFDALDLLGARTQRIRNQERQNEIERLQQQQVFIEGEEQKLRLRLRELQIAQQAEDLDADQAIVIRRQIEEINTALAELETESMKVEEYLRRVLSPDIDMDQWQQFISAMRGFSNQLVGIYQGILNERQRIATEERALLDRRISELQRDLDLELRLNEQGFASNVQALTAALEQEKIARDKAMKEEQRANENRMRMERLVQLANLLTAASNIFKVESRLGLIGLATAGIGLATLWSMWSRSAGRAAQATRYAEGGSWIAEGPRHSQGGIPFGKGREIEGGEMVSVFSRQATKKYGSEIKGMTDMFNKGHYTNPASASYEFDTSDIKAIRRILEKESITYADGYKIIKKGNTTIRCRLN